MKKKFLALAVALFTLTSGLFLVGCGDFGSGTPENKNYNADIQAVTPDSIDAEHFVVDENTTYYTSPGFSLWMEVNGEFLKMDYFSLDGNKRIYDNLYFYTDDYFYIVTDDNKDLYASLGDSADAEYAEEEKEQGYDIQINVKKSGIYKLIFDVDTLLFDMEYKSEIETPVYYTIKNCSIYSLATSWVEMSTNPANEDEFIIENFYVDAGKIVSFYNRVHTSNYKITLDEASLDKYGSTRKTHLTVNIGGNYNFYINKKTYVVRMELLSPDSATYSCVYYDGSDFITLEPYDESEPHIFRLRLNVDSQYESVPDFHTSHYKTYALTILPSDLLMGSKNGYFKQAGTYELIINLQTFTISVELTPN